MNIDFMFSNLVFNFFEYFVVPVVAFTITMLVLGNTLIKQIKPHYSKIISGFTGIYFLVFLYMSLVSGVASPKVKLDDVYIPDGSELEQKEIKRGIELVNSPTKEELSAMTEKQEQEQNKRIENAYRGE